ncbi:MAG: efflux RND transporter periplasmic adaptor subunit [Chlamydiales bacterium]|nr:efflux RND transporter periplasmic adaptor subunit [Chlamydiales bacterium]
MTTTPVIQKTVPLYIEGIGHIEPINSIDIKAQVTGVMTDYYFTRGKDVKKGDLLISIDPRPFQAEVQRQEATLVKTNASLKFAEDTARRNTPLAQDEYISQNTYDNLVTNVLTGDASVKETQAQLEEARIRLGYCSIYAPMDGRTSDLLVDPGNLVLENANQPLVTLNQITPIYATFSVSERYLPRIQRKLKISPPPVLAWVDDKLCPPFEGTLDLIDNTVDVSTGMVMMKANMPNEEMLLWPGQFVTCHIVMDMLENALLIPDAAILINSKHGKYTYVVTKDNKVEKRDIEVGQRHPPGVSVICSGLNPGEQVVLEGQVNITDGMSVIVKQTKTAEEAVEVEMQLEELGMPP